MPTPHLHAADGTDAFSVQNTDGTVGARFDTYGRRRVGTTKKPVATAAAGAGTTPTITNTGTDEHGQLTVTAGTSPAAGSLATLAFSAALNTPVVVIVSPNDNATSALTPYASASGSTLTIGVHVAPTAAATYVINYQVVSS